ncbi:putative nuclear hormone receptor HR3, partial [Stegodyphus mimosarum]
MSRDAVKFGRMSKKQREKVEDEVRFHRAQLVRPQGTAPSHSTPQPTETSPDSSVFDHQQQPSSSNQHVSYINSGSVSSFLVLCQCLVCLGFYIYQGFSTIFAPCNPFTIAR